MSARRVSFVVLVTVLMSTGLSNTPGGAGGIPEGRIIASLTPPSTHYFVGGAVSTEDWYYEVYWDETTAGDPSPAQTWGHDPEPLSCGFFYPNRDEPTGPTRPAGENLVYSENSALWDHPNSEFPFPGTCPHEGTDHPGLVIADVYESYHPSPPTESRHVPRQGGEILEYFYPPIPAFLYHCEYVGPQSGTGPPCVLEDITDDYCSYHGTSLGILVTLNVVIQLIQGQILATFQDGGSCSVPRESVERISIIGGGGDETVEIDWESMKGARIGLNMGAGANTLSLTGSGGQDWFGLHGIAPTDGFSGGLAFDFNQDGIPDFSAANVQYLNVDLGAGNDTAKLFPENLYSQFGMYTWHLDGGGGMDRAMMLPSAAGHYNFGSGDPSTAMVNLDSDQGDGVDVFGTDVETWFAKGTAMPDVFTGNGGAGTGGPFRFKLKLTGAGGNDKLTGGVKDDTLNGGPGSGDVCKGGKGTDTALDCETKKGIPKLLP
jgi:hypothetical protein